jgi:lipid A disaccharide synthetase
MAVHAHFAPKQRIDIVEDRIQVLKKQLDDERKVSKQLQEIVFTFASRLSEVEQHQEVLRNIMARMAQRMEVLERGLTNSASQRNRPVCSLDPDELRMGSERTDDAFASVGSSF